MQRNRKPVWLWLAIWLIVLLPSLAAAHKAAYDRMVVFGDSLSDPGNAYILLGTSLTPPYATLDALLVPDAPYAIGGNHFSNGPTWAEQLAKTLSVEAASRPAYGPGRYNSNYAVGGARARSSGSGIDLGDQVSLYLSRTSASPHGDTLYVVEFGGNDVRDAIAALALDPSGGLSGQIVTEALTALSDNLLSLYGSGAREFLIVNSPDLSLTPAIRTLDLFSPGSAMAAAIISAQFNAGLDGLTAQLSAQLPGVTLATLDIYRLLHAVVADPAQYRLSNAVDPCVMPNVPPFSCRKADHYLFWDGIHPTKAGHGIFADFAIETLFPAEMDEDHGRRGDCRRAAHGERGCAD